MAPKGTSNYANDFTVFIKFAYGKLVGLFALKGGVANI